MQGANNQANQGESHTNAIQIEEESQIMSSSHPSQKPENQQKEGKSNQELSQDPSSENLSLQKQDSKPKKAMKVISQYVDLENLVFEKRERKKSNTENNNSDQNRSSNGKKNKEKPNLNEIHQTKKKIKSENNKGSIKKQGKLGNSEEDDEENQDIEQEEENSQKSNSSQEDNDEEENEEDSDENEDEDEENSQEKLPEHKVMTRKGRGCRPSLDYVFPKNIRGEEEDFGRKKKGRKKKKKKTSTRTPLKPKTKTAPTSEKKPSKPKVPKEQVEKRDSNLAYLNELNRIFKKDNPQGKNLISKSELFSNYYSNLVFNNPKTEGLEIEEEQQQEEQENEQNEQNQTEKQEQNEQEIKQENKQEEDEQNNENQKQNEDNNNQNQEQLQITDKETQRQIVLRKKEIEQDLLNPEGKSLIHIQQLNKELKKLNEKFFPSQTYLNCDLKYFNFDFLTENFGNFDVILADPPWRIKGGQGNDSQFMFSNSRFNLEYNTMSNQEIRDLKIEKLSKKGFMFLWILNTQMNIAYEMMNKWGYEVIDQIVWCKLKDNKIYLSHGYYFMHSFEICLVGFKNPQGEHVEYLSKISNNIIFAEVRKKSQKPEEIYEMIELMMPGSKKIELFSRNHNLRPGWFSLGNQLGDLFEKWNQKINCDSCQNELKAGIKRYKSKIIPDHDLCEQCVQKQEQEINLKDFLEIENKVDEDILHYYHRCDHCHTEPIWGIRFECQDDTCQHDYCETCLDKNISLDPNLRFHDVNHELKVVEVPKFAHGFQVHSRKCQSCHMKPIIGICFTCKQCNNFNLCQPCFFSKTPQELSKGNRGHKADHKLEAIFEPQMDHQKQKFKCNGCCLENIQGDVYQCDNCYGFYFCQKCYLTKRDDFKTQMATSHKNYHQFTQIQYSNGSHLNQLSITNQ